MPNLFVSDIECYYPTKNVLIKIQQNKSYNNLLQVFCKHPEKNLTAFGTGFNVSIFEHGGTILEAGRLDLKYQEGSGETQKPTQ